MAKKKVLTDDDGFKHDYDFIDRLNDKMEERETGLKDIPLEKIRVKKNVRSSYEKIEEMAQSIKEKGIIQPITVTQSEDGFFDIVFGHRRFKGYLFLHEQEPTKYLKIQAIVKEKDFFDEEEIKEVQLIENIQRDNLKPLELKSALEYFRTRGLSNKEIALKLGKGEGYVKNIFSSIKTINKSQQIKDLMKSHTGVTLADIQIINTLPFKEQVQLISEKAEGKIKTRKELQDKAFAIKELLYVKSKAGREIRNARGCFSYTKNSLKIKLTDIQKASDLQRQQLLSTLKDLVVKIEEGFNFKEKNKSNNNSEQDNGGRSSNSSLVETPFQESLK